MREKASKIIALIADQHTNDVFVSECKGGPTWGAEHDRMDAWAMRKSWSRPLTWAYEVKVSRQDFLNDRKWHAYLAYCNEFYFVCPKDCIRPDELPPEAGLLYVASTGGKLFKKKAAARRDVAIPEELWRYLLMSRMRVKCDGDEPRVKDTAYWKDWLAKRDEDRSVGWAVSKATGEYVRAVEGENAKLKRENEALALFKQRLAELGHDPSKHIGEWQVRDAMEKLRKDIPPWVPRKLDEMERMISTLRELVGIHSV